ncbi:MAG: nitroreductase family protein [Spirochaetales bacterium]|nr:nitroreductase family protein [Spirochaetales bacterium]
MEAVEAIMTLRSVRLFTAEAVSQEVVERLLRAAMQAPSARNAQPWHFLVISSRGVLDAVPSFHPYSTTLLNAPLAILVCGDQDVEKEVEYINQDCAAATQNVLVAAHALGLGAVWLAVYPHPGRVQKMRKLLHIPDRILPVSLIALGHPAEDRLEADRYKPERVYYDAWGEVRI